MTCFWITILTNHKQQAFGHPNSSILTLTGRARGFAACSTMLKTTAYFPEILITYSDPNIITWNITLSRCSWMYYVPFPPKLWPTKTRGIIRRWPTYKRKNKVGFYLGCWLKKEIKKVKEKEVKCILIKADMTQTNGRWEG